MTTFTNLLSEMVIISYWNNSILFNKFVESECSISINDCKIGEWVVFSKDYKRVGKFRTTPCAVGDYTWTENNNNMLEYNMDTKNFILSRKQQ